MVLNILKLRILLPVYFVLSFAQGLAASEVDYIQTHLPPESYIRQQYNEINSYNWLRRLFHAHTLESCQKINDALKRVHHAAELADLHHEDASRIAQQQVTTNIYDIAQAASEIMIELRRNQENSALDRRDYELTKHKNHYNQNALPATVKGIVFAADTAITLSDSCTEISKIREQTQQKTAVEAIYLDMAVRTIWKKTTGTELTTKNSVAQSIEKLL